MIYVLYTIHVFVCLFLILVVLLQQGKGADLSVFGGGATQAAFGARGAVSLLHKLTVWGFVAFIVTTVTIGFLTSSRKSSSVLSNVPAAEEAGESAPAVEQATGAEAETVAPETGVPPSAGTHGGEAATDEGADAEADDGEGAADDESGDHG